MEAIEFKSLYTCGSVCPVEDEKFAEELYCGAFPSDERRDFALLKDLVREQDFTFFILKYKQGCNIGILSLWHFEAFDYIEHFAVSPSLRGGGLGASVLEKLIKETANPIVLEVEPPTNDLARRRIAFYERCGFRLLPFDYMQPPYDSTKNSLELHVMTSADAFSCEESFNSMVRQLHSTVYGVRS